MGRLSAIKCPIRHVSLTKTPEDLSVIYMCIIVLKQRNRQRVIKIVPLAEVIKILQCVEDP